MTAMKLIDSDSLYSDINNYALKYMSERDTWKLSELEIMRQMLEWTLKIVSTAPTIEHEKHGHWVLKGNGNADCSCCGYRSSRVYDDDNADHYCRHCGAAMVEDCDEKV